MNRVCAWIADHAIPLVIAIVMAALFGAMYFASQHDAEDRLRRYEHALSLATTKHDTLEVELTFERERQHQEIDDEDAAMVTASAATTAAVVSASAR